MGTGSSVAAK